MTLYEALSEPGSVRGLPGVFQGSSRVFQGFQHGSLPCSGPKWWLLRGVCVCVLTTAQPSVGERYLRDLFMVVDQERRGSTHYRTLGTTFTAFEMRMEGSFRAFAGIVYTAFVPLSAI